MTEARRQNRTTLLSALPAAPTADLLPDIRATLQASGDKVVILDDDPTGTQTVHDVTVLTTWDVAALTEALADPSPAVFVLTNTRSMPPEQAVALNREVAANLRAASRTTGRAVVVVSRSDSTLRGHFPLETDVLAAELGGGFDGVLIAPAFMAGGRYTVDSVHYVAEGDDLIPVAETPFAQDKAFGYSVSDLRGWCAEKTGGRVAADDVQQVTIAMIREGGVQAVQDRLQTLGNHAYCVVDAVAEGDLAVVVLAALRAEATGKRFLYRTAASFAALRAGITLRPLLTSAELHTARAGGGLVVVGSYVPKSSSQLGYLLDETDIARAEVQVPRLLDETTRADEIERVVQAALAPLRNGDNVVVYTTRELVTGADAAASLAVGNTVSASLVAITQRLQGAARFMIAKGGITSSDIATKALAIRRARVAGQILPGVPVWELDATSSEPGLVYVVFPGNVGEVSSVADAVARFAH